LCRVRDVLLFLGLGTASAAIPGALVATAAAVVWLDARSFWSMAISWWSSDVLGIIILGPLVLSWAARQPRPPGGAAEALILLAPLTGVGWWVFGSRTPDGVVTSLPYVLMPFAAWAALRFETRGAALATIVIDLLAVSHTMAGSGPFARLGASPTTQVLNV